MIYAILAVVLVGGLLGLFIWGMFQPVETEQSLDRKARKQARKEARQGASDAATDASK